MLSSVLSSSCDFTKTDEDHIFSVDGTEYVRLAPEGTVCAFGEKEHIGGINGENAYFIHLSAKIKTGMLECQNDAERRNLVRSIPDNEFTYFYRKASLPPIDLTGKSCSRLELVKGDIFRIDIGHMTCGDGIVDKDEIKAFFADMAVQKTAGEAELYKSIATDDGQFGNYYVLGSVLGFFEDEPNLALKFDVVSFNDKAYSVRFGNDERVFPEKWLPLLQKQNP